MQVWARIVVVTFIVLGLQISAGTAQYLSPLSGPPPTQTGSGFVFTAYDILQKNFYDPVALKPAALYDASLQGLAKYLKIKYQRSFIPTKMPVTASRADAEKQFAAAFAFIATSTNNLKLEPYELEFAATHFLLEAVDDSHTHFTDPKSLEDYKKNIKGAGGTSFSGIGAQIRAMDPGFYYVLDVMPGSPAERAGIQPTDIIVAIDGDPVPLELDYAVSLIRGPQCTTVVLGIKRAGVRMDITIERDDIASVYAQTKVLTVGTHRFGYVHIYSFMMTPHDLMVITRTIYEKELIDGVNGFIVDLRGNLGGRLDVAEIFLDIFLPAGTRCFIAKSANRSDVYTVNQGPLTALPVTVLIDESSASASEILSGVLQEQGRATVIGTKSAGALSIGQIFSLPNASGIEVAIAQFFTMKGKSFEKKGVMPDVIAITTKEAIMRGEDPPVKKAVEILKAQMP